MISPLVKKTLRKKANVIVLHAKRINKQSKTLLSVWVNTGTLCTFTVNRKTIRRVDISKIVKLRRNQATQCNHPGKPMIFMHS